VRDAKATSQITAGTLCSRVNHRYNTASTTVVTDVLDIKYQKGNIATETATACERINPQVLDPSTNAKANIFFAQAVAQLALQIKQRAWEDHRVQRFECAIPAIDLLQWLQINGADAHYYWRNRKGTLAISGLDAASHFRLNNMADLDSVFDLAKDKIAQQNCRYLCNIGFNANSMRGIWQNAPQAQLVLPLVEATQHYQNYKLAINLCADSATSFKAQKSRVLSHLERLRFDVDTGISKQQKYTLTKRTNRPSRDQWPAMVEKALQTMQTTGLRKLVLARHVELDFAEEIEPTSLLERWQKQNHNCFAFLFKNTESAFLGCSPERLFHRNARKLSTEALAGTVSRGTCLEEDFFYEQQLRSDPKLRLEHQLVMAFLRQRLSEVATNIDGLDEVAVFKLAKVQHLYFPLRATLNKGINDAQLLNRLHPTPAVCGVPQSHAMNLIDGMEPSPRGLFSGVVGVVSPQETEMCVAIRSALLQGSKLNGYSGVGIVEGSEEQLEWEELEAKVSTLLDLFS